jgi:hypothetical protein
MVKVVVALNRAACWATEALERAAVARAPPTPANEIASRIMARSRSQSADDADGGLVVTVRRTLDDDGGEERLGIPPLALRERVLRQKRDVVGDASVLHRSPPEPVTDVVARRWRSPKRRSRRRVAAAARPRGKARVEQRALSLGSLDALLVLGALDVVHEADAAEGHMVRSTKTQGAEHAANNAASLEVFESTVGFDERREDRLVRLGWLARLECSKKWHSKPLRPCLRRQLRRQLAGRRDAEPMKRRG